LERVSGLDKAARLEEEARAAEPVLEAPEDTGLNPPWPWRVLPVPMTWLRLTGGAWQEHGAEIVQRPGDSDAG
jgi:hypothetical protein